MPNVANDWTKVRYELDKSENFEALCNSPWYSDTVYDKFSPEEYARRHKLARELIRIIKLPDIQERLGSQGLDAVGSSPEELAKLIRHEIDLYAKLVKQIGFKPI